MKARIHVASRTIMGLAALALAITPASADVLLFDSFNTEAWAGAFNDRLDSDQAGTVAPVSYALSYEIWEGYIQSGNGGSMLLAGYDNGGNMDQRASLNRNFADDANFIDTVLEIKFNLTVSNSSSADNWATLAIGASQNLFVNDAGNKFSSLFRDNGGTQQFAAGSSIGDTASFSDGDLITVLLSNTAGTGSAFMGNGSVAKLYVNGNLGGTFSDLGLTASDGYISFQANGAQGRYDNLTVSAIPEPASVGLLGLGVCALLRRRRK